MRSRTILIFVLGFSQIMSKYKFEKMLFMFYGAKANNFYYSDESYQKDPDWVNKYLFKKIEVQ